MIAWEEVAGHNSRQSCWVVIKGAVFDITNYLFDHPGGPQAILRYGGKVRSGRLCCSASEADGE